jgi:hypothetical protein
MRISAYWLQQPITAALVILMAVPLGVQAQQPVPAQQAATPAVQQAPQPPAQTTQALPNDPASVGASASNPSSNAQSSAQAQPQEPVGTAAAPYEKPLGVPASSPAGAVIAPGKQKRSRSILIKVGLIVGAAVAIGTVVALSESSSSRPN